MLGKGVLTAAEKGTRSQPPNKNLVQHGVNPPPVAGQAPVERRPELVEG